jgi:hypothetical protein
MTNIEFARQCFGNFFTRGEYASHVMPTELIEEAIACIANCVRDENNAAELHDAFVRGYERGKKDGEAASEIDAALAHDQEYFDDRETIATGDEHYYRQPGAKDQ